MTQIWLLLRKLDTTSLEKTHSKQTSDITKTQQRPRAHTLSYTTTYKTKQELKRRSDNRSKSVPLYKTSGKETNNNIEQGKTSLIKQIRTDRETTEHTLKPKTSTISTQTTDSCLNPRSKVASSETCILDHLFLKDFKIGNLFQVIKRRTDA